jgi:hypothetical protein
MSLSRSVDSRTARGVADELSLEASRWQLPKNPEFDPIGVDLESTSLTTRHQSST